MNWEKEWEEMANIACLPSSILENLVYFSQKKRGAAFVVIDDYFSFFEDSFDFINFL